MRWLLILLLPLLAIAQIITVDEKTIKQLGINLYEVKAVEETEEIKAPGKVSEYAGLVAEVHPPVSGVVKKLYVKEGDRVKKGSPLALVYSPQIADLRAQLRMAQVRLKTAQETLKREEMLYKEEVTPYARYYGAKIEYEKAKGEYEALLASLRSFGEVVGDGVLIRSPINGYVVEQKVFVGSGVDTSKLMFKVRGYELLWVYAYVQPSQIDGIKKGMVGYIPWQGKKVLGKVDYISYEVDPDTKRVPVRLLVNNKEDLLRPGLMVDVVLALGKTKGTWLPAQAVQKVKGQDVVFVKVPKGFEVRKVRKLKEEDNKVLVEGLKEGEKIAVSGLVFLKAKVEQ